MRSRPAQPPADETCGEPGSTLPAFRVLQTLAVGAGGFAASHRAAAEETPVAIVYDASTHAVLMATPADLADLGLGFSLTEGIVDGPGDIASIDVVGAPGGVEVRMWLGAAAAREHLSRRRAMVGPTGCGLCGVESLEAALPRLRPVSTRARWSGAEIMAAVQALRAGQPLGEATRAVHAAGLWLDGRMAAVREDVGRHNALDKLAGATIEEPDRDRGIVALTSRVSVEMVQKAARLGVGCIAAISAPTALAVRTAQAAGVTLAAVVRDDGFEVFAHAQRIVAAAPAAFSAALPAAAPAQPAARRGKPCVSARPSAAWPIA